MMIYETVCSLNTQLFNPAPLTETIFISPNFFHNKKALKCFKKEKNAIQSFIIYDTPDNFNMIRLSFLYQNNLYKWPTDYVKGTFCSRLGFFKRKLHF